MEHPLIGNLSDLTEDQLTEKITELNRKLGMAMRIGNGHLCGQIRMAIENYQGAYQNKISEKNKTGNSNPHFDKIDIQ